MQRPPTRRGFTFRPRAPRCRRRRTTYARRCASSYRVVGRSGVRFATMSPGGTGPTTLAELGEFSLIAAMTDGFSAAEDVLVGPGDDAAVLAVDGALVTTIDVLVEGVRFRRDWSAAADIGGTAVAVNVADLEAMGARARGFVIGFSAPAEVEVRWALDLAAGLRQEAEAAQVSLLGGDTTRARDVTLAVTAYGVL